MKKLFTLILLAVGVVGQTFADTYVVAGMPELTDEPWNAESTINVMTTNDNINYTITFNNVFLKSGTSYAYKIVKNGNWDSSYPSNNKTFTVQESGVYNVTCTFSTTNNTVADPTVTKQSDANSALFLRCSIVEDNDPNDGDNTSSWDRDYPRFRFVNDVLTLDASNITTDITCKIKWSDSNQFGRATSGAYTVEHGIATNVDFGYYSETGNDITIPQSTLKCDYYVITINSNTESSKKFSVQGYEKVKTNSSGYCTYASTNPVTITGNAYYATDKKNGSAQAIKLSGDVAAGTAMLIKGTANSEYSFALATTGTSYSSTNAFKAGTSTTATEGLSSGTSGSYNYILNGNAFYAANGKKVAVGKAYLQLSQAASARGALVFPENEDTGVEVITSSANNADAYYNLNGQRIATPSKGLNIVNGRKVIMK